MLELLHQRDLADGSAGGALLRVEADLLEGDQLAGLAVAALEDGGIGALSQLDTWGEAVSSGSAQLSSAPLRLGRLGV